MTQDLKHTNNQKKSTAKGVLSPKGGRMLLGEILIQKKLISCQQLNYILSQQQKTQKKVRRIVIGFKINFLQRTRKSFARTILA